MNGHHDRTMERCPYCGQITTLIWVHGHGQCAHCSTNIDECCRGECHAAPMTEEQPATHGAAYIASRRPEVMDNDDGGLRLTGVGSAGDDERAQL